ncbi:hypothetical protein BDZ91DRAFT_347606 [Kalaharituber pfeilii]|nr:hypothetical protein BDZ91DRAFT_347606 [Kalaharituber pfeilii]
MMYDNAHFQIGFLFYNPLHSLIYLSTSPSPTSLLDSSSHLLHALLCILITSTSGAGLVLKLVNCIPINFPSLAFHAPVRCSSPNFCTTFAIISSDTEQIKRHLVIHVCFGERYTASQLSASMAPQALPPIPPGVGGLAAPGAPLAITFLHTSAAGAFCCGS